MVVAPQASFFVVAATPGAERCTTLKRGHRVKAVSSAEVIELHPPDVQLEALKRGDARAMDGVLRELVPFTRALMFRVLGPGAALDDATQDALIQLSTALLRWEGRSSLRTYAGRVVVRVAYRHLRARMKERDRSSQQQPTALAGNDDPEARCGDRQTLARLYHHLDLLAPKHRMAFVLCDVEGMTPSEAAGLMRCHPVTMRSHLARARRRLRKLLSEDESLRERLQGDRP